MIARRLAWFRAPTILAAMVLLNPLSRPSYLEGDFRAFYCASAAVAERANPYLEEPLRSCEQHAGPPAPPRSLLRVALPAPLPPYALAFFVPFALLPFPLAAAAWLAVLIAAMVAATSLWARVAGTSSALLNVVFAAITATVTWYVGQPTPLVFVALAGAALLLRNGRWTAASACAAAAAIEPHLALPALAAMFVLAPRTRLPLVGFGLAFGAISVAAVGVPTTVQYVREVIPAHALANAYEWQYSLTSVLTSFGVAAPLAVRLGEAMFAGMVAIGIVVAHRLARVCGDRAPIVLIPPAFAVFGGVHVHFQQLAIAFPAILYVCARFPRVRSLAASGLAVAMIPWNVLCSTVLAGFAPLLVGAFGAAAIGRRAGLVLAALSAVFSLSLLGFALAGLGPADVAFVPHAFPADSLAERSWGEFSRAVLARPSLLTQWLRLVTLTGLACGLVAVARAAFMTPLARRARNASLRVVPVVA